MELMLDKALALVAEGFHIAPIYTMVRNKRGELECNCSWYIKEHTGCKPAKHPTPRHGYKSASNDPAKIKRWFSKHPRNIGIATGPTHLIAFDPDTRKGGDTVLDAPITELGPLPPTRAFQSGSGDVRYIYHTPGDCIEVPSGVIYRRRGSDNNDPVDTLDIIASTGGLVVAGTHWTGKPYIDLGGEVADLPWHWVQALRHEIMGGRVEKVNPPAPPSLKHISSREGSGVEAPLVPAIEPRPEQLHALQWLWARLRPTKPFPGLGELVRCFFHDDGKLPGSGFVVSEGGYIYLRCFHESQTYSLQELYALHLKIDPPKGEKDMARMRNELYLESGAVARPMVRYEPLLVNESGLVCRVYEDVINRLEHNWVSNPGKPVMYTASFGAARLQSHPQLVKEALITLRKRGLLVRVGQEKLGNYRANLWLTSLEAERRRAA